MAAHDADADALVAELPPCEACGTCAQHHGCADDTQPLDLARGDCPDCGACGLCRAECADVHDADDPGPAVRQQYTAHLRAMLDAVTAERDEYRHMFDLQWTRMGAAVERWRAESPAERALVSPDLGDLLGWLLGEVDALARARGLIDQVRTWRDQCEIYKANHDALIGAVNEYDATEESEASRDRA